VSSLSNGCMRFSCRNPEYLLVLIVISQIGCSTGKPRKKQKQAEFQLRQTTPNLAHRHSHHRLQPTYTQTTRPKARATHHRHKPTTNRLP
jgi:hypothetical protein